VEAHTLHPKDSSRRKKPAPLLNLQKEFPL